MFPTGLPGVGLLLLRLSTASAMLLQMGLRHEDLPIWWVVFLVVGAVLLGAGLFTPILAILAIGVQFENALHAAPATWELLAVLILDASALALLGPGAYSVDARRFGRRVVHLPSGEDE